MFNGTEEPLAAEQWLNDITNLLDAAKISAVDQVKVGKVQLANVARTWWQAVEAKLGGQAT